MCYANRKCVLKVSEKCRHIVICKSREKNLRAYRCNAGSEPSVSAVTVAVAVAVDVSCTANALSVLRTLQARVHVKREFCFELSEFCIELA